MEALFGEMSVPAKFFLAFVIVLGLIGIAAFLMRRFGGGALMMTGPRSRQPRLAVIDAASVDGRRRLVLIRRDNTEHLLLIGGPTDIVIEPNILRTGPNAGTREREMRPGTAADALARQLPAAREPEPLWPQPVEPMPRVARSLDEIEPADPEPFRSEPQRSELSRPDPLRADPLRPDPTSHPARDIGPIDLQNRISRGEPAGRPTPPPPLERYRPDTVADEFAAPSQAPGATSPEPVAKSTNLAPAWGPDQARSAPPAMPAPPRYEPVFQTAPPEPRRPVPVPLPPAATEPALGIEEPSEPKWPAAPSPPPTREPAYQSAVISESKRAQTIPPTPRPSQSDESNLAEMAQRLEAALRRPIKPVEPVQTPAPASAPPARATAPVVTAASRVAAYFESPAATVPPPALRDAEPPSDIRAASTPTAPTPQASFESLEEEMASLLGRSSGKT